MQRSANILWRAGAGSKPLPQMGKGSEVPSMPPLSSLLPEPPGAELVRHTAGQGSELVTAKYW